MLLPFFLAPRHGRLGFERNMLQRTERWGGNPNLHLKIPVSFERFKLSEHAEFHNLSGGA